MPSHPPKNHKYIYMNQYLINELLKCLPHILLERDQPELQASWRARRHREARAQSVMSQ